MVKMGKRKRKDRIELLIILAIVCVLCLLVVGLTRPQVETEKKEVIKIELICESQESRADFEVQLEGYEENNVIDEVGMGFWSNFNLESANVTLTRVHWRYECREQIADNTYQINICEQDYYGDDLIKIRDLVDREYYYCDLMENINDWSDCSRYTKGDFRNHQPEILTVEGEVTWIYEDCFEREINE